MKTVLSLLVGCAAVVAASSHAAFAHTPSTVTPTAGATAPVQGAALQDGDDELAEALAEERVECDRLRRRGQADAALRRIDELLREHPRDAEARLVRARCLFDAGDLEGARAEALRAVQDAGDEGAQAVDVRLEGLRIAAHALVRAGKAREALELCGAAVPPLAPSRDARDAWVIALARFEAGERAGALQALEQGASAGSEGGWQGLLARGLCQRRLGRLEAAAQSFVDADEAARGGDGREPDVLVALADLYFEADREVEAAKSRSPALLYDEALRLAPDHEGALLGDHELHDTNWMRKRKSAHEILARALSLRPRSIEALVRAAESDLDDGDLKRARERLALLSKLAPERRAVRALNASLAFIERKPEECERLLTELAKQDPLDGEPEAFVGTRLLELYRFAEGLPFLKRAVERSPSDWEALTQLGRAYANTGDEDKARETLARAGEAAAGRRDAWRENVALVLKRMAERHVRVQQGDLAFSWEPAGEEILRTYLIPFYASARAELVQRYGFTPGPTLIEVFSRHEDFSVRSTGFQGFPALGVCFGPVVTAVSPLSELRGTQSWARTSFHEFTHVVHLGISHNRCPRWITEGLATWEEVNRNPTWTRNMRRELVDAIANGEVIPVRDLNRAFRGPRILFGYYQGGLVCEMLVERAGFAPLVRILEAFDRGADLDTALKEVYAATPEELDQDFAKHVARATRDLRIEPRWNPSKVARLRAGLARTAPTDAAKRAQWIDGWCTVAWSAWQQGKKIDAQEALRTLKGVTPEPPRALFLRGEVALSDGDRERASEAWKAAFDAGAEDYRARMALGHFAQDAGELEEAERCFLAAEKAFPGYDERDLSAERELAKLYDQMERTDDAMRARERWLRWNAGALKERQLVAAWHANAGRMKDALKLYEEANEIDPFLRSIHREWGEALRIEKRFEEALREFGATLAVPANLDSEDPSEWTPQARAEVLALEADVLRELGRKAEAAAKVGEALALDDECALARETLSKL